MKSKLFLLLVVLVMLVTVVGLGSLDSDAGNSSNSTTPENSTPEIPDNNTYEQPPVDDAGSVSVVLGDSGPEPKYFVQTTSRAFMTTSLSISTGDTVRIMNMESMNFRHLFHSSNGAFEDFTLDPRYSSTLTFNRPGTYEIQLLNYYTGEPFGNNVSVLTVIVTDQPPIEHTDSVSVVLGDGGPEPKYFVQTSSQKFTTTSLSISTGDTIRIMNMESRTFRHLFHSTNGSFEDFNLDPRYSATLTFSQPGTYEIQLLNLYTGEPFGDTASVLTVTVTDPSPIGSADSVSVVLGDSGPEPKYFVQTSSQKFTTTSLIISTGETIRIMNTEPRIFRHLFHSDENAFEDFTLDRSYSAGLTFNQPGTYKIQLLNHYTGEPFGDTAPVLTVTVS